MKLYNQVAFGPTKYGFSLRNQKRKVEREGRVVSFGWESQNPFKNNENIKDNSRSGDRIFH